MGSIVGLLGSIGSPDLAAMFRVSGFLKTCSDTLLLCDRHCPDSSLLSSDLSGCPARQGRRFGSRCSRGADLSRDDQQRCGDRVPEDTSAEMTD